MDKKQEDLVQKIKGLIKQLDATHFAGVLKHVPIEVSTKFKNRAAKYAEIAPKKKKNATERESDEKTLVMRINPSYLKSKSNVQQRDLILHEMIHGYLFITKKHSLELHGDPYYELVDKLNDELSASIGRNHTFKKAKKDGDDDDEDDDVEDIEDSDSEDYRPRSRSPDFADVDQKKERDIGTFFKHSRTSNNNNNKKEKDPSDAYMFTDSDSESATLHQCPMCNKKFSEKNINAHIDKCLDINGEDNKPKPNNETKPKNNTDSKPKTNNYNNNSDDDDFVPTVPTRKSNGINNNSNSSNKTSTTDNKQQTTMRALFEKHSRDNNSDEKKAPEKKKSSEPSNGNHPAVVSIPESDDEEVTVLIVDEPTDEQAVSLEKRSSLGKRLRPDLTSDFGAARDKNNIELDSLYSKYSTGPKKSKLEQQQATANRSPQQHKPKPSLGLRKDVNPVLSSNSTSNSNSNSNSTTTTPTKTAKDVDTSDDGDISFVDSFIDDNLNSKPSASTTTTSPNTTTASTISAAIASPTTSSDTATTTTTTSASPPNPAPSTGLDPTIAAALQDLPLNRFSFSPKHIEVQRKRPRYFIDWIPIPPREADESTASLLSSIATDSLKPLPKSPQTPVKPIKSTLSRVASFPTPDHSFDDIDMNSSPPASPIPSVPSPHSSEDEGMQQPKRKAVKPNTPSTTSTSTTTTTTTPDRKADEIETRSSFFKHHHKPESNENGNKSATSSGNNSNSNSNNNSNNNNNNKNKITTNTNSNSNNNSGNSTNKPSIPRGTAPVPKNPPPKKEEQDEKQECPFCGKQFPSKTLFDHINELHPETG